MIDRTLPAAMASRLQRSDLARKTIDIHSHAGICLKAYAALEYPAAATIEGIYYRQIASQIDVNAVFPFAADLYFDPTSLSAAAFIPAAQPLSSAPYLIENAYLLREVYDFCPEHAHRFLPFISVDPCREIDAQLRSIEALAERYPIYGIKINPVLCQSPITGLLEQGKAFVELARKHDWPFLLHTTAHPSEKFSNLDMTFAVVEHYTDVRFCLAHCLGFHKPALERADQLSHVWVDTSALTIQVQIALADNPAIAPPELRVQADFTSHIDVMQTLARDYPDTLIWGSDTPAYSYIAHRAQGDGKFIDFHLKATYEDEVAALRSLDIKRAMAVATNNSLNFLFGHCP